MPDSTMLLDPVLLPDSVFIDVKDGSSSNWDITISGGGFLDGTYAGWCIDWYPDEMNGWANVYSSVGEPLPDNVTSRINEENLDSVNWILNQDWYSLPSPEGDGFNADEIQKAIWTIIDSGNEVYSARYSRTVDINYIVERSLTEGDGFIPTSGDFIGLILEPQGGGQVLLPPIKIPEQPSIDIEKYIRFPKTSALDPIDADTPEEGPDVLEGYDPLFDFVITNDGKVDLYNVTVTDNIFNLDGLAGDTIVGDGAYTLAFLGAGETKTITLGGFWEVGQHTNTATVSSDYTNTFGETITVGDSDDANYFGVRPDLDIEKFVSVDGGTEWFDADTTENQPVSLLQDKIDPQFRFVVENTGNVDLTSVIISDDIFALDGFADDPVVGDGGYTINFLSVGDSFTLPVYIDQWRPNQHTNVATAASSYTDDIGNMATPTDDDEANYDGQAKPELTDKIWCEIYVTKNSFKQKEPIDLAVSLSEFFEDIDDGFDALKLTLQVTKGAEYFEQNADGEPKVSIENGQLLFDFIEKQGNLFDGKAEVTVTATDPDGHSVDYILPISFWGNGSNKEKGSQVFEGNDCNEYFHGGRGKDTIYGNGGDDILNGGGSQATLVGGEGADTFVLAPKGSYDSTGGGIGVIIADFEDGVDVIGLTDGLTYDRITLGQTDNGVEIFEILDNGKNHLLGIVNGAIESQFDASDFQAVTY